jgi:hypothetical protein
MLLIWNKYLPIQEGWFHYYAKLMLDGKIPYKDFYLFLQPLYPLEFVVIEKYFSTDLITGRILGLGERLILLIIVFFWLRRLFGSRAAFLATVTSMAVYASNTTDVIYSYYQSALIFTLLSGYFALHYLDDPRKGRQYLLVLSGMAASVTFFYKQSSGLLETVAILAVVCIVALKKSSRKEALWASAVYLVGWLIPFAIIVYWLIHIDAFPFYFQQVFRGGASSKGSLASILFGFWERAFQRRYIYFFLAVSVPLLVSYRYKLLTVSSSWVEQTDENRGTDTEKSLFLLFLVCVVGFLGPYLSHRIFQRLSSSVDGYFFKLSVVHVVFYALIIWYAYLLLKVLRRKSDAVNPALFLIMTISLTWMYSHGMSFTLEEHAIVPSLGLIVGFAFSRMESPYPKTLKAVLIGFCFLLIALSAVQRYTWTYSWWGWTEQTVYHEKVTPRLELLKGFSLSSRTEEFFTDVTEEIRSHTTPTDHIYTFPHIPIFNYLTNRDSNTLAAVHYFDVCPDSVAAEDAKRLLADPPAAIVYMNLPEEVWKFHEQAFRKGMRSGQRDIQNAIKSLTANDGYRLAKLYRTPGYDWPVEVWLKNRQSTH